DPRARRRGPRGAQRDQIPPAPGPGGGMGRGPQPRSGSRTGPRYIPAPTPTLPRTRGREQKHERRATALPSCATRLQRVQLHDRHRADRTGRPPMRLPRTLATALALAPVLATPPAAATSWSCSPESKVICSDGQCEAEPPEVFSHAESFSFDSAGPTLGACLWTDCYEGPATLIGDGDSILAAGRMHGRPDNPSPVDVVLAIDAEGHFTAVWQLSGRGAVISGGRCTTSD